MGGFGSLDWACSPRGEVRLGSAINVIPLFRISRFFCESDRNCTQQFRPDPLRCFAPRNPFLRCLAGSVRDSNPGSPGRTCTSGWGLEVRETLATLRASASPPPKTRDPAGRLCRPLRLPVQRQSDVPAGPCPQRRPPSSTSCGT